jgi:hypothetical protein
MITKNKIKCDKNKIVIKMAQILKIENSKYWKIFYNNFQQVAKNIERFCFFFFFFFLVSPAFGIVCNQIWLN